MAQQIRRRTNLSVNGRLIIALRLSLFAPHSLRTGSQNKLERNDAEEDREEYCLMNRMNNELCYCFADAGESAGLGGIYFLEAFINLPNILQI